FSYFIINYCIDSYFDWYTSAFHFFSSKNVTFLAPVDFLCVTFLECRSPWAALSLQPTPSSGLQTPARNARLSGLPRFARNDTTPTSLRDLLVSALHSNSEFFYRITT
ncbi:MAG: hypothetical protein J5978_03625, partial [Spirochaetaceae bacterium]|nr:hypothetical protein [Spirochaetaceae bacterium]